MVSKITSKRTLSLPLYTVTVKDLRDFIEVFDEIDDHNKVDIDVDESNRPGEISQLTISADISVQLRPKLNFRSDRVIGTPPYSINSSEKNPTEDTSDYVGPYGNGVSFSDH